MNVCWQRVERVWQVRWTDPATGNELVKACLSEWGACRFAKRLGRLYAH